MMTGHVNMPMSQVTKSATVIVRIVGLRRWSLRLRLGLWCFRLACWIIPVEAHIETET